MLGLSPKSIPSSLSFSTKSISNMTSVIASATQAAHSLASSLLEKAQIQVGGTIPTQEIKEDDAHKGEPLVLKGKNIIVSPLYSLNRFSPKIAPIHKLTSPATIGRRPRRIHWHMPRPSPRIPRCIRRVQGKGCQRDLHHPYQRCLRHQVRFINTCAPRSM